MNIMIEKKNPLKQGLKQSVNKQTILICKYWKEESIKTRIETKDIQSYCWLYYNWKEESIKTRIETHRILNTEYRIGQIEKKNPLKQGLKPIERVNNDGDYEHWKEESIKTRIETWI